jgi:hypothetical protein
MAGYHQHDAEQRLRVEGFLRTSAEYLGLPLPTGPAERAGARIRKPGSRASLAAGRPGPRSPAYR